MRFEFFIDEFDCYDVSTSEELEPIAWVLSDNASMDDCERILSALRNVKQNDDCWQMSFNKSFLRIDKKNARCVDLYEESRFVELNVSLFEKLLNNWKIYLKGKEKVKQVVLK